MDYISDLKPGVYLVEKIKNGKRLVFVGDELGYDAMTTAQLEPFRTNIAKGFDERLRKYRENIALGSKDMITTRELLNILFGALLKPRN